MTLWKAETEESLETCGPVYLVYLVYAATKQHRGPPLPPANRQRQRVREKDRTKREGYFGLGKFLL